METPSSTVEKVARPPVVAILGHIDHGKSTLLDYIRKTNVTAKEAGGITQHASAYEISHTNKEGENTRITFLDTPGHEAFSSIRTRCANTADIGALIVSSEDGVKPQTLEVLKHIQECNLPLIVVITKIDKPSADVAKTKQGLAEHGVFVEGYGGNTPVIELSAVSGKGVSEFLDMISLVSALEGKIGEQDVLGSGVIIETRRDAKSGVIGVGIIQNGTVRPGLFAASSGAVAPIRFMLDALGNMVEELSFSSPIQIVGWDEMPQVGAEFRTFLKKDEAVSYAKSEILSTKSETNNKITNTEAATIAFVLKADTAGSLEAITAELQKLATDRIKPKIVASGVGTINENDVKSSLATPGTQIIGFHVKTDAQAKSLAERTNIPILTFEIIYELTDKVKEMLKEKEPKMEVEEVSSAAKVLKVFSATKNSQVIGARVLSGSFKKNSNVKIKRRDVEIGNGKVKELQQSKIKADEVAEGLEFGAMVESKIEIAPGDVLEAVVVVTK